MSTGTLIGGIRRISSETPNLVRTAVNRLASDSATAGNILRTYELPWIFLFGCLKDEYRPLAPSSQVGASCQQLLTPHEILMKHMPMTWACFLFVYTNISMMDLHANTNISERIRSPPSLTDIHDQEDS